MLVAPVAVTEVYALPRAVWLDIVIAALILVV